MTAELPPRPEPPRRWSETLQAWLAWFGPARLFVSAVSVVVVGAGVLWLVRAPAPTTEAGLPFTAAAPTAATGSTAPARSAAGATLPPPASPSNTAVPVGPVIVHVAGAVGRPGVYELAAGARVHSAIEAAGGASKVADLDGLNLAAAVGDGQRIYVPEAGEVDPATVPSGPITVAVSGGDETPAGPVDLNVATAAQLESLPGIGPTTAAAIIDDRERNGPFAAVADLERVPGIGPAKLAAIADRVTV